MSFLRPPPHSPCGRRLPLHQRHIAEFEVNQVVIWPAQRGERRGDVCILNVSQGLLLSDRTAHVTRTASPLPFHLPLSVQSWSAWMVWKPSTETLWSVMSLCSHVSVRHIILHSRYSVWLRVCTIALSILLLRHRTFPITTEWRHGSNLLLSISPSCLDPPLIPRRCFPPLHPWCVFLQSSGGVSTGLARMPSDISAISCSPL